MITGHCILLIFRSLFFWESGKICGNDIFEWSRAWIVMQCNIRSNHDHDEAKQIKMKKRILFLLIPQDGILYKLFVMGIIK